MTKNVLIIGNGFDLYHRMPTRYTDFLFLVKNWETFYNLYIQNVDTGVQCGDEFVVRLDEFGRLTVEAIEDFANYAIHLNSERIEKLGSIIAKNVWIKYFIEIGYSADGWIDFEAEIENLLKLIEQFFINDIYNCVGKIFMNAVDPIMFKAMKCVMENTKSLPLNVGLYSKSDVDKCCGQAFL